jgi:hypothetical protein
MAQLFGLEFSKEELLERVSSMKQIAGAKVIEYSEGKAAGVKAIDVNAGKLRFTVLADRGFDIGDAFFGDIPIAWRSKVGLISPAFFEHTGHQWLRSFYGGLITTCGLTHVGEPCVDGTVSHGLHGRISNTPAEAFSVQEYWDEDDYVIKLTGKMREAILYGENLVLTREIKCIYGQHKIFVKDVVENEGYAESPFMIMYHVNQPFPIVSEHSKVYSSALSVEPQQEGGSDYQTVTKPDADYKYETYVHNMPKNTDRAYMAVINEHLQIGVYLAYDPHALPVGNEWKMLGMQEYAIALEPSNTYNIGIVEARKRGCLPMLKPKERYEINLEIGILEGFETIENFKRKL